MKRLAMILLVWIGVLSVSKAHLNYGYGGDKVLLKDVKAITLHHGQYTNGRRSAGVPQLQCVGGSAGCHTWKPSVVQCINRGTDGYDAQWECNSEMPNQFKFGTVSVTCEGYDSPNDPYVLRGSCGLEYSLELTSTHHSPYYGQPKAYEHSKSSFGSIFVIIAFVVIAVAIYYTCINTSNNNANGYNPGTGRTSGSPPPPGFRSDFYPNTGSGQDYCGTSSSSYTRPQHGGTGTGGGGFWTGAATGGLLGYMFGSNSSRNSYPNTNTRQGYGFQDTFGSSSSNFFGGASAPPPSSSSSSTHTSTGYGGTKRR